MEYVEQLRQRSPLRKLILPGMRLSYYGIADWFLFSLFVLPTYFGVRLGFFDLTALRLFEILLLWCIFKDKNKRNRFIELILKCPNNIGVGMYMFVVIYTNLIHPSINTIFYWITNGVLVIYLIAYLVVYEYGIEGVLNKFRQYAYILTVISPLELFIGFPPFSLLDTLGKSNTNARFGSVRIMGNCSTTNGYAMYLMILFPLMCYDWKNKRIDLEKNKCLLLLMVLNIFLTGSRLTVGTLILGFMLCFLMQCKKQFVKSLGTFVTVLPVVIIILYVFRNVEFVRGILCTLFSAVDEVMGTSYAVNFGANARTLYNSSYYRELLWRNTFLGDWLNPWLGRGGNYTFGMFVEGYAIFSCDNFYVGQFIIYAYPGLFCWLIMSLSFFVTSARRWIQNRSILDWVIIVSIICYFISLWYLDQLQTFPIMMAVFGLIYAIRWAENNS